MVTRKDARRQARLLKSQRKAENFHSIKAYEKEQKRNFWKARYSQASKVKKPSAKTVGPVRNRKSSLEEKSTKLKKSLLDIAEEAIEKGVLKSDGEFDESEMNAFLCSSEGYESDNDDHDGSCVPYSDQLEENAVENEAESSSKPYNEDTSSQPRHLWKHTHPSMTTSGKDVELKRTVHGLLNRLSQNNFDSVIAAFISTCQQNSRTLVFEAIIYTIMDSLQRQSNLLDVFVLNYSLLISSLGQLISVDLVGSMLESCVVSFDKVKGHHDADSSSDSKFLLNLVSFLAYLYNLQAISCNIIVDLLDESLKLLHEVDVEIILRLVRIAGAQMRNEDSDSLKAILLKVANAAAAIPDDRKSSRFRFMIDAIQDLRYNRQKLLAVQKGELDVAKKLQKQLSLAYSRTKLEPLQVGLEDLRNASSHGRWWKVGAAWKPADSTGRPEVKTEVMVDDITGILKAKKLSMNTDLRRSIFTALMASDDYLDAYQRIVALKLTNRQEREVLFVLLYCCVREKVFNPFYSLVACKFLESRHNFVVTTKYAFWDRLKLIEDGANMKEISQSAKFFGLLLSRRAIGLEILRKLSFVHLSEASSWFATILFNTLFKFARDEAAICLIFSELNDRVQMNHSIDLEDDANEDDAKTGDDDGGSMRVLKSRELDILKTSLCMFLARVFLKHCEEASKSSKSNLNQDLIIKRVKIAIQCLK